jgi:hypothetical protein
MKREKREILRWMRAQLRYEWENYTDPYTGEPEYTKLAEDCACALNHPEWLDEETHIVWDMAIDVFELETL